MILFLRRYKLTRLQRAAVGIAHSRALGVHDYLSSRVSEMDNLQRDHSLTVGSDVQATLRRWKYVIPPVAGFMFLYLFKSFFHYLVTKKLSLQKNRNRILSDIDIESKN